MLDVAQPLLKKGIQMQSGELALYAGAPGLLYARARPAVLAAIQDEFHTPESLIGCNLRLRLENHSNGGWREVTPPRIFRLPGKWRNSQAAGNAEEIEAKLIPEEDADLQRAALTFATLRVSKDEQWTYWNEIDYRINQEPIVIVEGTAADTGMESRRLLISLEPVRTHWDAVLADTARREQFLRDIEAGEKK